MHTSTQFPLKLRNLYPILTDYKDSAGAVGGHYFHQDLWVARKVFQKSPPRHVDIGSRIDGFVAHLLSFMPVTVVDVRPLPTTIPGLTFVQADSMDLRSLEQRGIESLSSLHAVEHFGLGRYGDPVDPDGWRKGIDNLKALIAPGGTIYFSVPVGRERLEFNAHRIFNPETIIKAFKPLVLQEFTAITDDGRLLEFQSPADFTQSEYACGIFVFVNPGVEG